MELVAVWASRPKVIKRKKVVNFECSGGLAVQKRILRNLDCNCMFVCLYVDVLCPCLLDLPSAI